MLANEMLTQAQFGLEKTPKEIKVVSGILDGEVLNEKNMVSVLRLLKCRAGQDSLELSGMDDS